MLTRILYHGSALPAPDPSTATLEHLLSSKSVLKILKITPAMGDSLSHINEAGEQASPPPQREESQQQTPPKEPSPPPNVNVASTSVDRNVEPPQQNLEIIPFTLEGFCNCALQNQKRKHHFSEYFNKLSGKIQYVEESVADESLPGHAPLAVEDTLIITQHMLLMELHEKQRSMMAQEIEEKIRSTQVGI